MSIEQFYNNALDILEEIYNSTRSVLKISHMELASLKNRFIREINNMVGTIQGLEKMNIFISPTSCSAEAHYDYALENLRHLFDLVFTKNSSTISTISTSALALANYELRFTQAMVIAYMKNIIDVYEMELENSYYEVALDKRFVNFN
jgi:hypothetical protein